MRKALLALAIMLSAPCLAQTSLESLTLTDSVKWIDETPNDPEKYVGQIFVVTKSGVTPHYLTLTLPVDSKEEPTVKKSVLQIAKKDATVGFADVLSIKATAESVYEFQHVNSRSWSANASDPQYVAAITAFRNNPTTSQLFESKEIEAILICTGVVQQKIWYRSFNKVGMFGSGTYMVKMGGSTYTSNENYEEKVKFGLLLRPLSGYGMKMPAAIINADQINKVTDDAGAQKALNNALKRVQIKL